MAIKCPGKVSKVFTNFNAAVNWSKAQKCTPPCVRSRMVIAAVGATRVTATVWCRKPPKKKR
jgi:hypothetical protein